MASDKDFGSFFLVIILISLVDFFCFYLSFFVIRFLFFVFAFFFFDFCTLWPFCSGFMKKVLDLNDRAIKGLNETARP